MLQQWNGSIQMNNLKTIAIIVLIAIIAYFLYNQGCGSREVLKLVHDSIPIPVPIPKIEIRDTGTTKTIYLPAKADSNALMALLGQMDSLRHALQRANVRSIFTLDTVTPQKDTITVDCDEINRAITLKMLFAQRNIMVQREREVILQTVHPQFGIGAGIGYGITPSGTLQPILSINIQYNFLTF